MPFTVVVIVQIGCACCAGLSAAGEDAASTEVGRPVEVKVAFVIDCETGKLSTFFLNSATDRIDCGAKYHSAARS